MGPFGHLRAGGPRGAPIWRGAGTAPVVADATPTTPRAATVTGHTAAIHAVTRGGDRAPRGDHGRPDQQRHAEPDGEDREHPCQVPGSELVREVGHQCGHVLGRWVNVLPSGGSSLVPAGRVSPLVDADEKTTGRIPGRAGPRGSRSLARVSGRRACAVGAGRRPATRRPRARRRGPRAWRLAFRSTPAARPARSRRR